MMNPQDTDLDIVDDSNIVDTADTIQTDKDAEEFIQDSIDFMEGVFSVYEVTYGDDSIYFYGMPKVEANLIYKHISMHFYNQGYQALLKYELGEHVVIVQPFKATPNKDRVWVNVALAVVTFFTTMVAGSSLFGFNPITNPFDIVKGLPFTLAIMFVLGTHEMGHYLMAKRRGMHTSLPYFIPFPTIIGTMGAVIKHKGQIPNRKALFDVGISGPIVGLVASVIVTIIGLMLPPVLSQVSPAEGAVQIQLPFLFEAIAGVLGVELTDTSILHPVAFAGWVGMLVTALNLLPSGQLDGGHILRSMLGEKAAYVSGMLPFMLMSLGLYISLVMGQSGMLWIVWGFFLSLFAAAGHPAPLDDENKLDKGRMVLGGVMFVIGILCVSLVPFQIV